MIKAGKLIDVVSARGRSDQVIVVAVTRNPLDDIHAMDNVEFVMKQGTVYKQ